MAKKKQLSEDEQLALRSSLYFFLRMCKEQRVRIRKDMAKVIEHAWTTVKFEGDGPMIFEDSIHKQRSNLILPKHIQEAR